MHNGSLFFEKFLHSKHVEKPYLRRWGIKVVILENPFGNCIWWIEENLKKFFY